MSCTRDATFRVTQDFFRIEAIHSYRDDPADPLWLHVRITPADDLLTDVESALVKGSDPHGVDISVYDRHPYRLFTGTWAYDINPGLYEPGKQYVVHWRHTMQPDVLNVARTNFVWQPIPDTPRDPSGCILFGVVSRNRVPVADARVVVEEYRDFITLNYRLSQVDVTTDAFGYWWIEVPRNSIQRIVFNEISEVIKVPDVGCLPMKDAVRWSPGDVPKDSFGYPLPGVVTTGTGTGTGTGTANMPANTGVTGSCP